VREMPQPRRGVSPEGPQAVLPVAGLRLRQVHPHRGTAAGNGRAGEHLHFTVVD
jgi:hypothetical protein